MLAAAWCCKFLLPCSVAVGANSTTEHDTLLTDDKAKHKSVNDKEKEKINQDNEKALCEKEEKDQLNHAKHVDHQDTVLVPADTDERKPDHILLGKGGVDDRWSRPGLSQVPDAARLVGGFYL